MITGNGSVGRTDKGSVDTPPMVFLHMPKAAGSTLNRILDKRFAPGEIFQHKIEQGEHCGLVGKRTREELSRYKLVRGHLSVFCVEQLWPDPFPECMTVLREPISRVVSHYHYVRRMPEHQQHAIAQSSLAHFVEQAGTDVDNLQVRLLSGHNPWSAQKGECPQTWLDDAKQNLREKIRVVGVSEDFDAFLMLLEARFGWPAHAYQRLNVTPCGDALAAHDPAAIERIRQLNVYDAALHSEAAEIQREAVAALPASMQRLLGRLRRRQRFVDTMTRIGLVGLASAAKRALKRAAGR